MTFDAARDFGIGLGCAVKYVIKFSSRTQLHNPARETRMASRCVHATVKYNHDSVYEWHSFDSSADAVLENGCLVLSQKTNPENKFSIQLHDEDLVGDLTGLRARVECGRLGIGASQEQRVYTNEDFGLEFSVHKNTDTNSTSVTINANKLPPFHATVIFEAEDCSAVEKKKKKTDAEKAKAASIKGMKQCAKLMPDTHGLDVVEKELAELVPGWIEANKTKAAEATGRRAPEDDSEVVSKKNDDQISTHPTPLELAIKLCNFCAMGTTGEMIRENLYELSSAEFFSEFGLDVDAESNCRFSALMKRIESKDVPDIDSESLRPPVVKRQKTTADPPGASTEGQ